MISGIGVDIVKIKRFEKYAADPEARFMMRVFTEKERGYLAGKKAQSIAGLFAAKEAVAKALGTGFNGISPADIEILHKENGRPYVVLAQEKIQPVQESGRLNFIFSVHISISHTATDAVAFAVAESIATPPTPQA